MKTFSEYLEESRVKEEDFSDKELWEIWKANINMTAKQIEEFHKNSNFEKNEVTETFLVMFKSGKTFEEASKNWKLLDWKFCKKQVSTVSRYKKMRKRMVGNPFEKNGKNTKWYNTLLSLGNDPRK